MHRDVKSLNVFLCDGGGVKLGDFGVSRQLSDQTVLLQSFYGTPLYLSPEIIDGRGYTAQTDMWSLGVLLYELITTGAAMPFAGKNLK